MPGVERYQGRDKGAGDGKKAYQRRNPGAIASAAAVKIQYKIEPVAGSATRCQRLVRVWMTNNSDILPRRAVPVYGVRAKDEFVDPILFHTEIMCQHPGSMSTCIAAADKSLRHWLKHGDPEMPAGAGNIYTVNERYTGNVTIEIPDQRDKDAEEIRGIKQTPRARAHFNSQ